MLLHMAKNKTVFYCQQCGSQSAKWLGKCPDCNGWNTFVEEQVEGRFQAATPGAGGGTNPGIKRLSEISLLRERRFKTGLPELDRVLGGGVVPGSVVLIGGDPGIGKSTLILQAFHGMEGVDEETTQTTGGKALYVSGEESLGQIKMRADRLGIVSEDIYLLAETAFEEILRHASAMSPRVIVVDSIQTVYTTQVSSAPGSVTQIREVAAQLMYYAKRTGVAVFIIGHVTKEGAIAGPRVLEHIVDTVLYFEGDKSHAYRLLRAVKNRFGSTHEMGVFEMKGSGLVEIENPSGLFLAERPLHTAGSVVVAAQEGNRPILVELQALVSPSYLGMARRMALGVDSSRVSLLLAILEKRAGLQLAGHDVYVNVVAGIQIEEPAMDLGILMAIASSFKERPIPSSTVVFGEVGLAGEIRGVQQAIPRIKEAEKMGFTQFIFPARNQKQLTQEGIVLPGQIGVAHIAEALEQF
jgi:DNA repair protein RadA/Sms